LRTPTGSNLVALTAVALLLCAFAALSWTAVRTKSATADEPLHAVSAFVRVHERDFRVDPEDPPLFGYWAMIPQPRDAMRIDKSLPAWDEMIGYMWQQWEFVIPTMYRTPGVDPDAILARSRAMMLALGVALGVLVARWAWEIAGPLASVIAGALYALCPNFLGHAPLLKNDVPLALVMCGLAFATWRAGERLTVGRLVAVALCMAAACVVKFSGLLLAPILAVTLLVRALMNRPWMAMGRLAATRPKRLLVALSILIVCGIASVALIWACYGFRYAPTPDPSVRLNMQLIARAAARNELLNELGAHDGPPPSEAEIDRKQADPPAIVRIILFADRHQLLPQAWLAGLLDTYATTLRRHAFLLGEVRQTGWWYYFPLAVLFKTPLSTLVTMGSAIAVSVVARVRHRVRQLDRWVLACLVVPVVIYGFSALTSNLNLGLRHVLPLYPLAFVMTGAVLALTIRRDPRAGAVAGSILFIALIVETVAAHPNYIAYFNFAFGGPRGGIALLGDSNLDWGQDLALLRGWQQRNPDTKLYLVYFGGADPGYYVRYTMLKPGTIPRESGVIAISATYLQGIYLNDSMYSALASREPREVLGGTVYLFDYPPKRE
jgi:4-amino-4-deoxy-L-arabinose transferase-like glycosyltransferase